MRKIIFFTVLTCLLMPGITHAQLLIEQGKVNLYGKPGTVIADKIIVHNTLKDKAILVKVYWEDFVYLPPFKGKKNFLAAGSTDYSCSQLVRFSPDEFTLEPLGKREINYTVNIPQDPLGGYYGVLFFETAGSPTEGQVGVSFVSRLGSLFFIETSRRDKKASIQNLKSEGLSISGEIENDGNVIMIPKGIYYILNDQQMVESRGVIDEYYLPPEKKASFSFDLDEAIPSGTYTIVLTFDLKDGVSLVREIEVQKTGSTELKIMQINN